jgi:hypothetical protein
MPVHFKQVISCFLTPFAYEKLAVSATWHVLPGSEMMVLRRFKRYFQGNLKRLSE